MRRKPAQWELELQAHSDSLPMRTVCGFCGWEHVGNAGEGRTEAERHRKRHHRKLLKSKYRQQRHLGSFRQPNLTDEQVADVLAERDKRAFLIGIDISD